MRNDIREKLQVELNKEIVGELQVIYILSRIRKIIEIDKEEDKYGKIKFYCDWALHSKINNVGAVEDLLKGVVSNNSVSRMDLVLRFDTFHSELNGLLQEKKLSTSIYDSAEKTVTFNKYLSSIYADTPLIINHKIRVIWNGQTGEDAFGGSFTIVPV